ncbi:hypothetical protein [Roseomonas sp. USHLN139]|uniref:hypothetical protein n=1 Tax=Roseomonas sp. USHLN139 TaxID=3081298 RepID=UPI003B01DA51
MHLGPIEREQDSQHSTRGFLGLSRLAHARDGLRRFLGLAPERGGAAPDSFPEEIRSRLPTDAAGLTPPPAPQAPADRTVTAPPPAGLRRFLGLAPLVGVPSSLSRFLGLAPLPASPPADRFLDLAPVTGITLPEPAALAPFAPPSAEPRFIDLAPLATPAPAPRFIDLAPLPMASSLPRHVDLPALQAAAARSISLPALTVAATSEAHRLAPVAVRTERFVNLAPLVSPGGRHASPGQQAGA